GCLWEWDRKNISMEKLMYSIFLCIIIGISWIGTVVSWHGMGSKNLSIDKPVITNLYTKTCLIRSTPKF
ncbi:MAG: hypothetical protein MHPSP_004360, partial [Paramarteilia canceri]